MNSDSFTATTSVRRSKMVSTTTASNIMADESISLNKIMDLLRKANVPGPFVLNECHQGAVKLGYGAQFEVFGRRMSVASSLPEFDGPYLEKRTFQADRKSEDKPTKFFYTVRHVAIKRAYLSESRLRAGAFAVTSRPVQGVERTQLRNIIHEVLALIHPLLRSHPNVATLLGWGYDQATGDRNTFSPVLIVEHATMSAEDLCAKVRPPLGIRKHVCAGLLEGIKALHECGIIHNDVKPSNLLIYARNDPEFPCIAKISDFGFAQAEVHEQSLDVSKLPRGTPGWAAPEQENPLPVPVEFLHLRDIWGCGMSVWSILALHGRKPLIDGSIVSCVTKDFVASSISPDFISALTEPLAACLESVVDQRAKSVADTLKLLTAPQWTDAKEQKDEFYKIFQESTDWGSLAAESVTLDGALFSDAITPLNERRRANEKRTSWDYSLELATAYNAHHDRLLNHLESEDCPATELFNMGLAHVIDNRAKPALSAFHKAANRGYLPAQCLFGPLQRSYLSEYAIAKLDCRLDSDEWQWNSIASGFLFDSLAQFSLHDKMRAWNTFREKGGYNTHYCGVEKTDQGNVTGLLGNLEADLRDCPLHLAAAFDQLVTESGLSSLLQANIDINSLDHWGDTALMKCCMAGNLASLRVLIENGADAAVVNENSGITPLHWLFVFDPSEVTEALKLMVVGGARPSRKLVAVGIKAFYFPFGWPSGGPLHWAVFSGRVKAAQALIGQGADVREKDAAGQTSLSIAAKMLNVEMVEYLLQVLVNQPADDQFEGATDFVEDYTGQQADAAGECIMPDPEQDFDKHPVHDYMWELLVVGKDPDFEDWESEEVSIPLEHQINIFSRGTKTAATQLQILRLFRQSYPDCLIWRTGRNFTALDLALQFANPDPEVVRYLVSNGSPIDAQTIYFAIFGQYRRTQKERDVKATYLEILFESLTKEHAKRLANWTFINPVRLTNFVPLQFATIRGYLRSVQVLLEYGADPCLEREGGLSPLQYAQTLVHKDVEERMTEIRDVDTWVGVSRERSRQNYASEQKRMQEDTKRERIAILACFEDQLGNRLVN